MIDLTPLEVRKKKGDFRRALRGYDTALVDDFLDLAADRVEQLSRENAAMSERLNDLERRVGEYRDRERALTDALVTAQEMREEIRAQTAREAELALRTSTQEAEARLRDAEQRSQAMLRDAEQRSQAQLRDAEQSSQAQLREAELRSQTQLREAEQQAASTVREAEQAAGDTLRQAQQEAAAELLHAQQEAERIRAEVTQVREREEEALRRLRLHQQQQLSSYRNFLERELEELDVVAASLAGSEPAAAALPELPEMPDASQLFAGPEATRTGARDSRAAAAAAVLAQSFLADDTEPLEGEPLLLAAEEEPFEPEPVYEEDLEPRAARTELAGAEATGAAGEVAEPADDADTSALLENAELAGYRLRLSDELDDEPELVLEEPAVEGGDDDDDWLSAIIEDTK